MNPGAIGIGLDWQACLPPLPGTRVAVLLNARIVAGAEALRQLVQQSIAAALASTGGGHVEKGLEYFHPAFPRPTHRIG